MVSKSPSLVSMDHCHCPGLLPLSSLCFVFSSRESSSRRNCTVEGEVEGEEGDWEGKLFILECNDVRIDVG